jgi:hypothetical protein
MNYNNVILCTGYASLAGYPCPTNVVRNIRKRSADAQPQVQIDNDPGNQFEFFLLRF